MKNLCVLGLMLMLLSSCIGDRKSGIGTNFNETSFINKDFSKNKMEFSAIVSPCDYVSKEKLAELYETSEDKVFLTGGNQQSKGCTIRIKISDQEFDYITGMLHFYEEPNQREDGSTWVEDWQLQKGTSRSTEWIPNMGKAAMYKASKRELNIRFNNYVMTVMAPGSAFNKKEKAFNRDYKKIALAMAKNTPLF